MNQDVLIREFASADAQAFHDLNMAWISASFQLEAKDEYALSNPEGTILTPGGGILVAEVDGTVAGCVALLPMPDQSYEVAKMAVAQGMQGRGVGRRLLVEAVAWAHAHRVKRLYLESNRLLTPALHLYESVGFRHLPPEEVSPSPYTRADVFMEMILKEKPA